MARGGESYKHIHIKMNVEDYYRLFRPYRFTDRHHTQATAATNTRHTHVNATRETQARKELNNL